MSSWRMTVGVCVAAMLVTGLASGEPEGDGGSRRGSGGRGAGMHKPGSHDEGDGGSRRGSGGRDGGMFEQRLLDRVLTSPSLAQEIGLTEAQIKAVKDHVYELRKEHIKRNAELELAAVEQAQLMTEDTVDEAAVMAAVEKAGKSRTEIAKLQVRKVLLLKRTLTPEQVDMVKEMMQNRARRMRGSGGGGKRGTRNPERGARSESDD